MKTYVLKYTLADVEPQKEASFEIQAESIDDAIKALVASFGKDYNPANVDFTSVIVDGEDLGENGIYDAEISLAKHYN